MYSTSIVGKAIVGCNHAFHLIILPRKVNVSYLETLSYIIKINMTSNVLEMTLPLHTLTSLMCVSCQNVKISICQLADGSF